jgi:hypothetical protein
VTGEVKVTEQATKPSGCRNNDRRWRLPTVTPRGSRPTTRPRSVTSGRPEASTATTGTSVVVALVREHLPQPVIGSSSAKIACTAVRLSDGSSLI